MIGKTVEFKENGEILTGVIQDKVLDNKNTSSPTTYYMIEDNSGKLYMIRPTYIIRIIQQSGIGHKPIQTK